VNPASRGAAHGFFSSGTQVDVPLIPGRLSSSFL
jgi:hypothetical protein